MGRRHCAVPQYGFQASGTADTERGAQEKAGRLHPSLGMVGGLQQAQDRDKGGKAGLATLGVEADRDLGQDPCPAWGWEAGSLAPQRLQHPQRSKLETADFPGRPHSAALSFLGCGRAPLPPATPTGNALGTALLWVPATAVPPASGAPLGLHGAGNGAGASEPPTSAGSGDCGGL